MTYGSMFSKPSTKPLRRTKIQMKANMDENHEEYEINHLWAQDDQPVNPENDDTRDSEKIEDHNLEIKSDVLTNINLEFQLVKKI